MWSLYFTLLMAHLAKVEADQQYNTHGRYEGHNNYIRDNDINSMVNNRGEYSSNSYSSANSGQYNRDRLLHEHKLQQPTFVGPIQNITVNVGRDALLECHINNLGKYKVGWLKAKDQTILVLHEMVITHNSRVDVDHEDYRVWKLRIRQVEESDRGCYMCQINTESMKKQIGCIDVLIPPQIDDEKTSSDVDVNEGGSATLNCTAEGHPQPKITWIREDKEEFPITDPRTQRRTRVKKHQGNQLKINKVSRIHMGAYFCIASNDVPPIVSKRIMLNVNFQPEISAPSQLHGVGLGKDITLTCKVQGWPKVISYWTKNDETSPILKGLRYNVTEVFINKYQSVMYLTIRQWRESDAGHFTCKSTNSLGKVERRIQAYTFREQKVEKTYSYPSEEEINAEMENTNNDDAYVKSHHQTSLDSYGPQSPTYRKNDRNQNKYKGYGDHMAQTELKNSDRRSESDESFFGVIRNEASLYDQTLNKIHLVLLLIYSFIC